MFEEVHHIEHWIILVALVAGACWIYSAFRRRAERELARPVHPTP